MRLLPDDCDGFGIARPEVCRYYPIGGERSSALLKPLFLVLVPCSLFLTLACGDGGGRGSSGGGSLPGDAQAIRSLDVESLPQAKALVDQLGSGKVDEGATLYADLTGDRREEAIVPVSSQGTLGNIAYLVLRLDSGKPEVVLTRTVDRTSASGLQMSVEDGVLVETRGVYGPEDPFCCPSQLRQTTFHWDGSKLQVEAENVVKQPGRAKD
jgi:hypothetical protein